MPRKPGEYVKKFWSLVDKTEACWLWTGWARPDGYGEMRCGPKATMTTHRYAWKLANGNIPAGLFVLHRCDTPLCVRPDHLFLGTPDDNSKDMVSKKRQAYGEKQGSARLTDEDIPKILLLHDVGMKRKKIAKLFCCDQTNIYHIVTRKTWKHVPWPKSSLSTP